MKQLIRQAAPITLLAAALLSGCSGGSQTAGIEGTGDRVTAKGTVTAFGSIWVNGVRFNTTDAAILVDGEVVSEEEILPGMVVFVEGTVDSAGESYAQTVSADAVINGPITEVTKTGLPYAQIHVLGQTVIVPEEAVFAGLTRSDLALGVELRVSGLTQTDGSTLATRLERLEQDSTFDVEGVVVSVDAAQFRLQVGELPVEYGNADLTGLDTPRIGQNVEIHGTLSDSEPDLLTATSVRLRPPAPQQVPGSQMVWEGLIEAFTGAASFELNGLAVDASTAAIERGSVNQLGSGVRVAVTGELDEHSALVADSIKLLLPSETRFAATVDAVDRQSGNMTLLNTTFNSDTFTAFEDVSPSNNRRMNFADVDTGDTVEVFGRNINGKWVASRIRKLHNDASPSSLRGPVGDILSDTEFSVMGLLVDASNAEGVDLLEGLMPGQFVTVEGLQTGPQSIMASRIELAESDDCPAPVAAACGLRPEKPTPPQPPGSGNGNNSSDNNGHQ